MAIDDRVIEAAARELWKTRHGQKEVHPAWNRTLYSAMAEAAVTAALRAMEPELRAAVAKLIDVCTDDEDAFAVEDGWLVNRLENAEYDLFARLGLGGDA